MVEAMPMARLKLVTVYESQGMLGAQVVKGKLESAGLPVLLKYESYGQVLGLTVDGLGLVEVQVPAELAEDALALLDDENEDEDEDEDEDEGL
jgi:hypothetical protein